MQIWQFQLFCRSEYELDLIILTPFSPRCGGTNPSHHANPLLSFSSSSGGAPEASPCAGYYSSSGVAADFLHTELGPMWLNHRVISDRVHRLLVTLSYFRRDRFVQLLSLIPILILLLYFLVSGCLTSLC